MTFLQRASLGAAAGSLFLLLGAFAFQYIGGYAPCPLCIWQRWPHAVAIALGLLVLVAPFREIAALGSLALLVGAGLGFFHVGVEQGWWAGLSTCAAPDFTNVPADQLLDQILSAPVVRCDDVAWSLLGVSMAGWNTIASLTLAGLWARAYASSSASQ